MISSNAAGDPWLRWSAALAIVAAWLLLEDYDGITHDATLYAFQALARLQPEAFAHDVALRFGSQDSYTIYSALYAPLISWLGLENAALLAAALSLALLALSAWTLARRLLGVRAALLGVALVIALPGDYGAQRVFRVFEMFATPRPLAEACVLFGLAACLAPPRARALPCVLAFAAAMALHPIIALPGIAVALVYAALTRWPALHPLRGVALGVGGFVAVLALAAVALPRMDDDWFAMVRDRVPYVLLSTWTVDDWATLAPRAAVLLVVARVAGDGDACRMVRAVAWVLGGSLVASWILADELHRVLALQVQPWRACWLATVVAAMALPMVAVASGVRARVALPLLACAWFADSTLLILAFSALSIAATWLPINDSAQTTTRAFIAWMPRIAWCAAALLAVLSVWTVSTLPYEMFAENSVGRVVNQIRMLALAPVVGFGFALGVYLVSTRSPGAGVRAQASRAAAVAIGVLMVAGAIPSAWRDWQVSRLGADTYQRFAAWRELIPRRSEVMCLDDARTCWFLLDRASYVSATQSALVLFSRDAAFEMRRRAHELAPLADPSYWLNWQPRDDGTPRSGVQAACSESHVDFIVAESPALSPEDSKQVLASEGALRLFRCADLRAQA